MPDIKNIQESFLDLRDQKAENDLALNHENAKLDQLKKRVNAEIQGLTPAERTARLALYEQEKTALKADIAGLRNKAKDLKGSLVDLSANVLLQIDPREAIEELNDKFPILMFPLRLETRFKKAGNKDELWLRVFPDDCSVTKKEPLLSSRELENAKSFWIQMWKAGGIETEERGAWRSLVNSHGSGRATWIVGEYKPVNTAAHRTDDTYSVLVIVQNNPLSSSEETALSKYWTSYWLAKDDPNKQKDALDALKSDLALTDAAAADIIEKTVPANIADEVPENIPPEKVMVSMLYLPAAGDPVTTKASWNQAPKAIALPDKFVAIAYNGSSKKTFLFENPVQENLPVGPDPSLPEDEQINKDNNKDITFSEDLQWLVDFDKAVKAGMGTRIGLTAGEASSGFDKLFVVGIRLTSDEQTGKKLLEDLLQDHLYSTAGFSVLKQGTPTNNTEDESSGYSWLDDSDESFDRVFKNSEEFTDQDIFYEQADGQKLAEALGIDPAILKKVSGANGVDQIETRAMNTALFPATLGYFMEEMMDPLFSDDDLRLTKTFFSAFVSGRGPLPAVRIGKQPYGILPVSVYSRMSFYEGDYFQGLFGLGSARDPFLTRTHQLVQKLDSVWDTLVPEVSYIGKTGDAHQILLDVIGLHPNSVEFHQRHSQTIQQIYNQLILKTGSTLLAIIIAALIADRGRAILRGLGLSDKLKLPILEKFFLSEPDKLSGPLVDDVPASEINPVRAYSNDGKNYIKWLTQSDGNQIRLQDFGGKPAPNALLYLLLRHSLLQAQARSATSLLLAKDLISDKKAFFDQDFLHVQRVSTAKSKFEHLYSAQPEITGDQNLPLIRHIYKPNILDQPEVADLKQTIDALKLLQETPTARLERLLVEHLDCCNYRLDAWQTGLVQYKLQQQRRWLPDAPAVPGLYLGAYGWLLDVRPKGGTPETVDLSSELTQIFNPDGKKTIVKDPTNLGHIHAPSIDQAATAAILRNAYDSYKGTGSSNPFAINLTSDRIRIANDFLEGIRNGQNLSSLLGYQFERGLHDRYSASGIEADKFIYPLRLAFPLVADGLKDTAVSDSELDDAVESNNLPDTSKAIETVEANNVIDGLKLIQHVQASTIKTYPFGLPAKFKLPAASPAEAQAVTDEVNRLIYIHDAIADLAMSEQVYQVVKGNFERASGVANAFSKGSYPPEMEIVNTPRSGTALTHRMTVHFDAEADPVASPNSLALMTPRAEAEPAVNSWLSDILPDPAKVRCKVTYSNPTTAGDQETTVSQADLGLQTIDLLFSANLDAEKAMTELDDRIMNYVRYVVSNHPCTEISIKYTDAIDPADRSIVSFFELGAVTQSLRKILLRKDKYLAPGSFDLPSGEEAAGAGSFDLSDLQTRVSQLRTGPGGMDGLNGLYSDLVTLIANTVSIGSLRTGLEEKLKPHITDESQKISIAGQLANDIKAYYFDPSAANKNAIIAVFETAISSIPDNTIVTALKADYESYLVDYRADLSNLDDLIKEICVLFTAIAFYDNDQTGTGFMHQAVEAVYKNTFEKLDAVIKRWDVKKTDFEALMLTYGPALSDKEKYALIRKAELLISPASTFEPPPVAADYKDLVDTQKGEFDALLGQLKTLKSNANAKVTGFIGDAETALGEMHKFDVVFFDTNNSVNDLHSQTLNLITLKEDMVTALQNQEKQLAEKFAAFDAVVPSGTDAEKISALLGVAGILLGDDALILPKFKLTAAKANEFEAVYKNSDKILEFVKTNEGRILPVEDWFAGVARVNPNAHDLENLILLSSGFKDKFIDLTPLQFPFNEKDRWLAMKFRKDKTEPGYNEAEEAPFENLAGARLLYTAHFAKAFDKANSLCGIVIDDWPEHVPSKEETTGITFHYDQPNSEPPQVMLLMVPPVINGKWEWNDVIESLEETLEMAKKRAVEPLMVEGTTYAQFLPTTMLAITTYWITVATNLAMNNISMTESEN